MASALAALGLMGRVEGAETDMVPGRTRAQICDIVRRESPYLHEVLSVLASVGEGAVQNGPQLFIAQDSFSTAGAPRLPGRAMRHRERERARLFLADAPG